MAHQGPFLPFMPNVSKHLQMWESGIYMSPKGEDAVAKAQEIPVEIPETSGLDQTPLGGQAIMSLAGMRNAADEMALAAQQAQAIARNSKIAAVRSYEALRAYQVLQAREGHYDAKLGMDWKGADEHAGTLPHKDTFGGTAYPEAYISPPPKNPPGMAVSPTGGATVMYATPTAFVSYSDFLFTPRPVSFAAKGQSTLLPTAKPTSFFRDDGFVMPARTNKTIDMNQGICDRSISPACRDVKNGADGSGVPALGSEPPGGAGAIPGMNPTYDVNNAYYLKNDMEQAFRSCKEASMYGETLAKEMADIYSKTQHASLAVNEALHLPGAPKPPSIPPIMLKPPKRPRDLSPFWLDVPYGVTGGLHTDPYAHWDDQPRDSPGSTLFGYPGFNPFEGTVPFSEVGLSGFYDKVKPEVEQGHMGEGIGGLHPVPEPEDLAPMAPPMPPG